jgi:RimJ/RimL family protein N-acetyltransferase
LRRVIDILREEGCGTLARRSFVLVRAWFFHYAGYYLYEHTMQERDETDFLPRLSDFTFRIIRTNQEADELAAATGSDFRRRFFRARSCLDSGAIAFCVFVGDRVVHIGYVGLSEEAKNTFDALPYEVAFSGNEACTGGTVTIPEFRGKGLMAYGYFKRFQFLLENGIATSRNVVAKSNIASQRAHEKFGPKRYAEARYVRFLGRRFWREMPLSDIPRH